MKHNRKAAEESLDLVYREKQQKMNELDVVVPLRLNQVEIFGVPLLIKPIEDSTRTQAKGHGGGVLYLLWAYNFLFFKLHVFPDCLWH